MKQTTNYLMHLPEPSDYADIGVLNENTVKIDGELKKAETHRGEGTSHVTPAEKERWDGKADKKHTHTKSDVTDFAHSHSAGDITAGTLPIARGGTGAGTAAGARGNLDVWSKGECLSGDTAALLGLPSTATPNDAFGAASKAAVVTFKTVDYIPMKIKCPNTPQTAYCFCYGAGKLIMAGNAGNVLYSEDGNNWSSYAYSNASDYNGMSSLAYGNGKFVGFGGGTKNTLYRSTDGKNWSASNLPTPMLIQWGIYGGGKFMLHGVNGYSQYLYISEDGLNWTPASAPTPFADNSYGAVYGNGKFVMVGNNGFTAYSADGLTWVIGEMPVKTISWNSVAYGNGRFVSVGYTSGNETVCSAAYSEDGIHWTASKLPASDKRWSVVGYGDGYFFAETYTNDMFAISEDGILWNWKKTVTVSQIAERPVFAFGRFYAGAFDGSMGAFEQVKSNVLTDYLGNILRYYKPGEMRIDTGSYIGNGAAGSSNPNRLRLPFAPKLLLVVSAEKAGFFSQGGTSYDMQGGGSGFIVPYGTLNFVVSQRYDQLNGEHVLSFLWEQETVSWNVNSTNAPRAQLNERGKTYLWASIS